MIAAQFGSVAIAEATMEMYTSAVLESSFSPPPPPTPQWRSMMDKAAEASCEAYRDVVHRDPDFVSYFRLATPEMELARLNIGSRPARRGQQDEGLEMDMVKAAAAAGGVETLRAIPWVFAWTQTRLLLPTWLGATEGLAAVSVTCLCLCNSRYIPVCVCVLARLTCTLITCIVFTVFSTAET